MGRIAQGTVWRGRFWMKRGWRRWLGDWTPHTPTFLSLITWKTHSGETLKQKEHLKKKKLEYVCVKSGGIIYSYEFLLKWRLFLSCLFSLILFPLTGVLFPDWCIEWQAVYPCFTGYRVIPSGTMACQTLSLASVWASCTCHKVRASVA